MKIGQLTSSSSTVNVTYIGEEQDKNEKKSCDELMEWQ